MSFDKKIELRNKYNELLDSIISCTSDNLKIKLFKDNYSDEDLDSILCKFCKNLESDNKLFKLFLNRADRIFGSKFSLKIIPNVSLKSTLSKNEYIWECIQLLYAIYRSGDEKYKDNINKIIEYVEKFSLGSVEDNGVSDKNDDSDKNGKNADDMIMDIANTLRNNIVDSSKTNEKVNPIENMLKTSQMISEKYGKDIQSGNFSMNQMFDSLSRMMDDIDELYSNDEELKKVKLDESISPNDLMKNLGIDSDKFNPMDVVSNMLNKKKETQDLTPEQLSEMEEFYKTFNSSDLNNDKTIGIDKNNDSNIDTVSINNN